MDRGHSRPAGRHAPTGKVGARPILVNRLDWQ